MDNYGMERCSNCGVQRKETEKYPVFLENNETDEQSDINVTIARAFEYLFGIKQIVKGNLCLACVSVLTELYVSKRNLLRKSHISSLLFRISNNNQLDSTTGKHSASLNNNVEKNVSIKEADDGVGEAILPCDEYEAEKQHFSPPDCSESNYEEMTELFPILNVEQLKIKIAANVLPSKEIHFTCKICQRKFANENLLESHHESVHSIELKKYECSLCHKKFSRDWFLKNHIDFAHNGITIEFKFKCDKCGANLSSEVELKRHKLEVHDIRSEPFNCNHCKESFHVISELRDHLIDFHNCTKEANIAVSNKMTGEMGDKEENDQVHCPTCQKKFKDGKSRKAHVISEHNGICVCFCGRNFNSYALWMIHSTNHGKVTGSFSCEICNFSSYYWTRLTGHYQKHLEAFGPPKFYCGICSKHLFSQWQLHSHMRSHRSYKKFKCRECDKTFKYQSVLDEHQVIIHQKGDFSCEKCARKFISEKGLISHHNWHLRVDRRKNGEEEKIGAIKNDGELEISQYYSTETLKFNCPFCLGGYSWKTNFLRHLRVFHKIKGYAKSKSQSLETPTIQCLHCPKLFARKDIMRRHILDVHKEIKQFFQCEVCHHEFKFGEFVRHVKMHQTVLKAKSKEEVDKDLISFYCQKTNNFICKCEEKFPKKEKFISHITSQHGYTAIRNENRAKLNLKFKCKHCDKSYLTNEQLREHMRKVRQKCSRIKITQSKVLTGQQKCIKKPKTVVKTDI